MAPRYLPAPPPIGLFRTAALLLAFLLPPVFPLGAQTPPAPRLLVETSPERPVSGGPWTLTLLVDHPRPGEVEVQPPPFPPALVPGIFRREPRLRDGGRWTALEYHFTVQGAGRLTLAPFEILSPRGRVRSSPLILDIEPAETGPSGGEIHLRLEWEHIPPRLKTGETLEFSLRIPGWDPRQPLPAAALLLPPTPPGCILEALEAQPGDAGAGRALRLRLIPLGGSRFTLPGRTLRAGDLLLDIPPLEIPLAGSN